MGLRPVHRRSKRKRRHQSASQRYERRFQDSESRTSTEELPKEYYEERTTKSKFTQTETAATFQKTRAQERRAKHWQEL